MGKTNYFLRTLPFSPRAVSATWLLLRKFMKNELNTCFQQKFATGSYGVGIGCAWCSRKAREICSSLVQKKKLKKKKISSHKLPKQQSTNFWSQGLLGVNIFFSHLYWLKLYTITPLPFPQCTVHYFLYFFPFFLLVTSEQNY
jgi:hypothetical protein